jgi:Cu2+-exporting ATPase
VQIPISGMSCQSCASSIETAVKVLPGAKNTGVNFALKQLNVDGVELSDVLKVVRSLGYDSPIDAKSPLQATSQRLAFLLKMLLIFQNMTQNQASLLFS